MVCFVESFVTFCSVFIATTFELIPLFHLGICLSWLLWQILEKHFVELSASLFFLNFVLCSMVCSVAHLFNPFVMFRIAMLAHPLVLAVVERFVVTFTIHSHNFFLFALFRCPFLFALRQMQFCSCFRRPFWISFRCFFHSFYCFAVRGLLSNAFWCHCAFWCQIRGSL